MVCMACIGLITFLYFHPEHMPGQLTHAVSQARSACQQWITHLQLDDLWEQVQIQCGRLWGQVIQGARDLKIQFDDFNALQDSKQ